MESAKKPQHPESSKDPIVLMRAMGLPVIPGAEYLADTPTKRNPASLQEVQHLLRGLPESLGAELRRLRDAS